MVIPGPHRRVMIVTAGLTVLVALLALASLGTGPVRLPPLTVIDALFGVGTDIQQTIVR
jgi:iron complex transport system permease protein